MVWIVPWVLAPLVLPTVRVSEVMLGGWCVSWWSDGAGVVGVGAGRGLRLGRRRFQACHSWLVVGRFVVLVGWCRLFPVSGRFMLLVVGGGAVLPLSVVLVTVLARAPPAELCVMSKARTL